MERKLKNPTNNDKFTGQSQHLPGTMRINLIHYAYKSLAVFIRMRITNRTSTELGKRSNDAKTMPVHKENEIDLQ
jgi:hypothetical protein